MSLLAGLHLSLKLGKRGRSIPSSFIAANIPGIVYISMESSDRLFFGRFTRSLIREALQHIPGLNLKDALLDLLFAYVNFLVGPWVLNWLHCTASPQGIHPHLWTVVCWAATSAMRAGMQFLDGHVLNSMAAGVELAHQASQKAVQHLWNSLADFCAIDGPAQWSQPPMTGPFVMWNPQANGWQVQQPPTL